MKKNNTKEYTYEMLYYDGEGWYTSKETNHFAIYKVSKDKTSITAFKEIRNGIEKSFTERWHDYSIVGCEKPLTEEEVFMLCL